MEKREREGWSALYHRRHGVILLERYAFFLLARQHSAPHKYLWIIVVALRCSAEHIGGGNADTVPATLCCQCPGLSRNSRRNMAPLPRNFVFRDMVISLIRYTRWHLSSHLLHLLRFNPGHRLLHTAINTTTNGVFKHGMKSAVGTKVHFRFFYSAREISSLKIYRRRRRF